MSPIQQMLLGVGAVATKTYVDDVFSTYVYKGTGSALTINNGINMSGEGGMTWLKERDGSYSHRINDTERGANKQLYSNLTNVEATETTELTSFNSNGFSLGTSTSTNDSNNTYASWTFRKAPGFFDVVTFNETGAPHSDFTVSHSLGCIPGMIILKRTDGSSDWWVWHKYDPTGLLRLNTTAANTDMTNDWCIPTSTNFTFRPTYVGAMGAASWVAYLFAGGESTAATARSVDFDGSNDYLSIPDSADFNLGTNSFTIEFWVYPDAGSMTSGYYGMICSQSNPHWYIAVRGDGPDDIQYSDGTSAYNSAPNSIPEGQWTHVAFVNNSGTGTWYINGVKSTDSGTVSAPNIPNSSGAFEIGRRNDGMYFNGKISNFRIVKGTAVYTSSFKPPTEPLTNITNTKLLCCNDSSQTGSTVTPGTITNNGSTASTDSPFDDPAGFTFGDAGDQNVIKCGSYTTDSNEDATIDLGWEPQWVLAKRTDSSTGGDWFIIDSMRGFMNAQDIEANNGGSKYVEPNTSDAEADTSRMGLTSTGFYADQFGANRSFIYLAIRRPDGYVGKPYGAGEGTSVFAMDTGNGSTDGPAFDSGFPVDMGLRRKPASGNSGTPDTDWATYNRLLGITYLRANTTDVITSSSKAKWDLMTGFNKDDDNTYQAWMWKRHAGFDVVAYGPGNEVEGRSISHSLNKIPEMIWIKNRDTTDHWVVYHKGLNGGTNPEQYYLWLETDNAEDSTSVYWNNTAPTSTHFTVGNGNAVNQNNKNYIAMLFASVDGISKVGYYDGSESEQTITTGFQPRFVIIKRVNNTQNWYVLDTTRGWASGVDQFLQLDTTAAQDNSYDLGAPTSTGFTLTGNNLRTNNGGDKFIYYAHA